MGTRRIAAVAVFAAVYAVLSLIPVSRLINNVSFLTMAETFSPLTGMILGPVDGGLSVLIGTFAS
ncbi:MAG: ECF transporter S component, partial [Thaumarchaeota archaeon]|nr:ECF transporter S component [Nitrososphaerota archaeon]